MSKKGLLILMIGPSGSGKGTVLKELLQSDENTFLSISATTRKPREGEQNGKNYFFMKQSEFEELRDCGGFLEYACYCGNYYGTPKRAVLERLENGENVILEIEMQGASQVKAIYPEALMLFITPPSFAELKKRLTDRNTEDAKTIESRLKTARVEFEYAYRCDYIVLNDTVKHAVDQISAIMTAGGCTALNNSELIDSILNEQVF